MKFLSGMPKMGIFTGQISIHDAQPTVQKARQTNYDERCNILK